MNDAMSDEDLIKTVLRDNLGALMKQGWGKKNLLRLSREAGIGPASATRIDEAKTAVGLDIITRVARVFDLDPWQLLVPNLDPENPPQTSADISPKGLDLARCLDAMIADPARHAQVHALLMQQLAMLQDARMPELQQPPEQLPAPAASRDAVDARERARSAK